MTTALPADEQTPILHHYDFSPFAEKIRLALGFKSLHWRSVIAPSVMPKPELTALTGGYRHIPVLQIGANVYCDTRTIARELDRRWPIPALVTSSTRGRVTAIEAWAERDLFWSVARYVSGINADTVDPQLHVDRAALRGKPTPSSERLKAVAQRNLGLLRAQLPTAEQLLADGRAWLLADAPGQADLALYHCLWFLSVFKIDCAHELVPYPWTRAWMARVADIGHGSHETLSPQQALQIAGRNRPDALRASILDDALPPLGCMVAIRPDDYTTATVNGELVYMDHDDVALRRQDAKLGAVHVYLPRVGYTMKPL
jgi:glutathione S-transferase